MLRSLVLSSVLWCSGLVPAQGSITNIPNTCPVSQLLCSGAPVIGGTLSWSTSSEPVPPFTPSFFAYLVVGFGDLGTGCCF